MHENMAAWLEKLRKTRLPQGDGFLREDGGGYCCLGIACLAAGMSWRSITEKEVLDTAMVKWLGFEPDDQHEQFDLRFLWPEEIPFPRNVPRGYPEHITAAWLNDVAKLTFPQIADMVEYFGVEAKGA